MVFRRLRGMFGGPERGDNPPASLYGLGEQEREKIGTKADPLLDFEAAMQRNEEAERALQAGDTGRAIDLLEKSVSAGFVGSYPQASQFRNPYRTLSSLPRHRLLISGQHPRKVSAPAEYPAPTTRPQKIRNTFLT